MMPGAANPGMKAASGVLGATGISQDDHVDRAAAAPPREGRALMQLRQHVPPG